MNLKLYSFLRENLIDAGRGYLSWVAGELSRVAGELSCVVGEKLLTTERSLISCFNVFVLVACGSGGVGAKIKLCQNYTTTRKNTQ